MMDELFDVCKNIKKEQDKLCLGDCDYGYVRKVSIFNISSAL